MRAGLPPGGRGPAFPKSVHGQLLMCARSGFKVSKVVCESRVGHEFATDCQLATHMNRMCTESKQAQCSIWSMPLTHFQCTYKGNSRRIT